MRRRNHSLSAHPPFPSIIFIILGAIAPVSTLIATGVSNLTQEEIEVLFSAIPVNFELKQILIEELTV